MGIYTSTIEIYLNKNCDIKDITDLVEKEVYKSGILTGIVNIFAIGSTASLTTIEYERGVISDLKNAIYRLVPDNIPYAHDMAWHDGNGHSHVQAAIMGPSLTIPIRNNRLMLGTWQQIVLINHDVRSRNRKVEITVIGE